MTMAHQALSFRLDAVRIGRCKAPRETRADRDLLPHAAAEQALSRTAGTACEWLARLESPRLVPARPPEVESFRGPPPSSAFAWTTSPLPASSRSQTPPSGPSCSEDLPSALSSLPPPPWESLVTPDRSLPALLPFCCHPPFLPSGQPPKAVAYLQIHPAHLSTGRPSIFPIMVTAAHQPWGPAYDPNSPPDVRQNFALVLNSPVIPVSALSLHPLPLARVARECQADVLRTTRYLPAALTWPPSSAGTQTSITHCNPAISPQRSPEAMPLKHTLQCHQITRSSSLFPPCHPQFPPGPKPSTAVRPSIHRPRTVPRSHARKTPAMSKGESQQCPPGRLNQISCPVGFQY